MCFMCLTHPRKEVQERFLVKLLELNTLNEHIMRRKYLFIRKTIFDKVQKLAERVIKSLQLKKTKS